MIRATSTYKQEMDPLGEFLEERCELQVYAGDLARTKASHLLRAYQAWSSDRSMSSKRLAKLLRARGYESKKEADGTYWIGIELIDPEPVDRLAIERPA